MELKRKEEETEELAQGLSSLHETESKESDTETELLDSAEKLAFEKAKEHGKMIANYKIAISNKRREHIPEERIYHAC